MSRWQVLNATSAFENSLPANLLFRFLPVEKVDFPMHVFSLLALQFSIRADRDFFSSSAFENILLLVIKANPHWRVFCVTVSQLLFKW